MAENVPIFGKDLVWVYIHFGSKKFMTEKATACSDVTQHSLFNIRAEGSGNKSFLISPRTNKYLQIGSDGNLTSSFLRVDNKWNQSRSSDVPDVGPESKFHRVPVPGSESNFYIHAIVNNEPLVTPDADAPFGFHIQSRYPNESPAQFSFQHPKLPEIYRGDRNNIIPTLKRINTGEFGDKCEAYAELFALMTLYGHLGGHEIFDVGMNMLKNIGSGEIFYQIPEVVQHVVSGYPLSLFYIRDTIKYPMKYATASDKHKNILPYTFTYDKDGFTARWTITYANEHQLYVDQRSSLLLEEILNTKRYKFQLDLNPELKYFNIKSDRGLILNLSPVQVEGRFNFQGDHSQSSPSTPKVGVMFSVNKYV